MSGARYSLGANRSSLGPSSDQVPGTLGESVGSGVFEASGAENSTAIEAGPPLLEGPATPTTSSGVRTIAARDVAPAAIVPECAT